MGNRWSARRWAATLLSGALVCSTVIVTGPAQADAQLSGDPISFEYSDHYYETPEGYRTTDTDADGIDPWGCEAYTYPYAVDDFWDIEPEQSFSRFNGPTSYDALVERDIAEAQSRDSDCWYERYSSSIDFVNYLRAYHGMPPVKPWYENDYVTAAVEAQEQCECPLRHWTEITDGFNEGFEGVTGVELAAFGGISNFYGSQVHRSHLLHPQVDYISMAFSAGYVYVLTIRSDARLPNHEHAGFPTLGERYDSLNERNWTIGPEVEPFYSPVGSYFSWLAHHSDEGTEPPIPTPDTIDDRFNVSEIDPNSQPVVGWQISQQPEAEALHKQIILDYINGLREVLNDDDVNWPEFNPEPVSFYEPPTDRPNPRLEQEGGPSGDFIFQYIDEDVWGNAVPVYKNSDSTFANRPGLTPLARAVFDLGVDQRYRILTDPQITEVEISIECRTVDGVPDGGVRLLATGVFDRETYDFSIPDTPRGHEIAGWDEREPALFDQLLEEYDEYFVDLASYTQNYPCPFFDETSQIARFYASEEERVARELAEAEAIRAREELVANTTCGGLRATIVGDDGPNAIFGTDGDDVIHTLGGRDEVIASAGNDVICLGDGDDRITTSDFDDGHDIIYGGAGVDHIIVHGEYTVADLEPEDDLELWRPIVQRHLPADRPPASSDPSAIPSSGDATVFTSDPVLYCNGREVTVNLAVGERPTSGDDVIRGTAGPDEIEGLGGNDVICSLQGDDRIDGGDGFDQIFAGAGNDTVVGGVGNDRIVGGNGNDLLWGNNGNDRLQGGLGNDVLRGDNGTDRLAGGSGHDTLWGGTHDDLLFGHLGRDVLHGEEGNDVLRGGAWQDEMHGGNGTNDGCTLSDPAGLSEVRTGCEGGVFGR